MLAPLECFVELVLDNPTGPKEVRVSHVCLLERSISNLLRTDQDVAFVFANGDLITKYEQKHHLQKFSRLQMVIEVQNMNTSSTFKSCLHHWQIPTLVLLT